MVKLSTILLSLAHHLLYDIEKELCNCCVRLLSNCFMDVCSTQLKSKFVLTPGVDGSNVHWGTISFGKNVQESIKFMGLHKYIKASPWSFLLKTFCSFGRILHLTKVNSETELLHLLTFVLQVVPDSLLRLRLGKMLVEEERFRQGIWKHRIISLMDQSLCRAFSPPGAEPMLQETIKTLNNDLW